MTTNASVTRHKRRLVVRAGLWSDELREVCAAVPGARWSERERIYSYPATLGIAALLHNALRVTPHADNVAVDDDVQRMHEWARRAVAARACRVTPGADLPLVPSRTESWEHQAQAFHWGVEQEAVLLDMDMGTGKSKVAVDLINAWSAKRVVVLAGKRAVLVWPKQFRLHSLADYHVSRGNVRSQRGGGFKKNPKPAERIEAIEHELDVYEHLVVVVNYELAWREPFRTWLLDRKWDVIVLDEGHRVRAPGGKQGRFAATLRDTALGIEGGRRVELTGTVMPHSPLDLYGQGRFLEPALFGTSYEAFKTRYGKPRVLRMAYDVDPDGELIECPVYLTDPQGRPIMDGVRDEVKSELAEKLASVSYHVSADDALDLPHTLDHTVEVELDAKTSKVYRDLETELVAEVDAGVVTVDNALSKLLRLQQVTSGHVPIEVPCTWCPGNGRDGTEPCPKCKGAGVTERVDVIGTEKQDALIELFGELPRHRVHPRTFEVVGAEPVVTFARFTHDLVAVQTAAEKADRGQYVELSGSRADALTEDGELVTHTGVAGVNIKSGSEGIDFTRARLVVYYSLGYELMPYRQSRSRTRRPGADLDHKCEYVHLVAVLNNGRQTVDGDVLNALARRQRVVDDVHTEVDNVVASVLDNIKGRAA